MIDIHIGFDLSFNSTGITFYNELYEDDKKIKTNIEFHRLVRDKEINTIMLNLNQHIYYSQLLSVDLDLKHKQIDDYQNAIPYSSDQIDLTEKYYVSVNHIMKLIVSYMKSLKEEYQLSNKQINIYINFEGSILSGHNFNTQIGVNMLQGYLRGELLKFQLVNHFNKYKFRMVPPTQLKMFFTRSGDADKKQMIESFIENYDGKKLLPQINLSNKMTEIFNDVIDSFALVAFNVYDLKMLEKDMFNIIKPKSDKPKKKRTRKTTKVKKIEELIDTEVLKEFESDNLQSELLIKHGIIIK